ncbi:hypothetical protein PHLCEN_2v1063 [Hermanssonia centrifuga]|uniref:Nudix hydrolase domain-containing protein n=1 Tax=Hermanssonia centrifuga TaxID=98765 RepID=A0A2R6S486_9APHY|nr:hypothetical protein PHLCEN_2v1063 [Hermanssonia centrifuga]
MPSAMDLKQKFVGAVEDEWQMYRWVSISPHTRHVRLTADFPFPSDQLSDYTIGPPIGFGASSIVHTAVFQPPPSSNAPTPCALKVVDLDRLPPHALHLLMQETKLMSLSKHPNVLRIRGQWMDGHKLHIAMRLMNAGSAADVMRYAWPGGMEEEVVKCILRQTLEGLNYLHTNGLIHRDVKAANLLIDDDGTVLLGDLGVAAPLWESDSAPRHAYPTAHYTPSSSYTHTHPHHLNAHSHTPKRILGKRKSFVGTPCWMAPEVITGKQYNASADIWSFGITALELTSGHPPLSRSSPSAVLSHIASSPPPSLTRDNGLHKYSSTFFDIVQSCLNKDPAQRPTAEQLLDSSFFKGAKKKGYLVGTVLKGLPPLVQRQERRQLPSLMTHTTMDSWDFALTEVGSMGGISRVASPTTSVYSHVSFHGGSQAARKRRSTVVSRGVFDIEDDDNEGDDGVDDGWRGEEGASADEYEDATTYARRIRARHRSRSHSSLSPTHSRSRSHTVLFAEPDEDLPRQSTHEVKEIDLSSSPSHSSADIPQAPPHLSPPASSTESHSQSSTSDSTGGTPTDPDVPASQSATPPSQLLWRKLVGRRKDSFGEGDGLREKDASGGGDTLRRKVGMLAGKGVGIMRTVSRVGPGEYSPFPSLFVLFGLTRCDCRQVVVEVESAFILGSVRWYSPVKDPAILPGTSNFISAKYWKLIQCGKVNDTALSLILLSNAFAIVQRTLIPNGFRPSATLASPSSTQPHTSSPPLAAINDVPASVHVFLNIMSSVVQEHATILPLLSRALNQIRSTPPRIIASPATQPRRAAVALILRVSPPPTYPTPSTSTALPPPATLAEFFQLDWVNAPGARPEILFLRREKPDDGTERINGAGASSEAHVAFPGGRTEDGDEGGMYTAMRQTWEEIGLDLAESAYTPIGQLDDREITTSLGKRLLMILSPFVFLQLTPHTTPIDPAPGTSLHWVPLSELLPDSLTAGKEQAGPRVRRPRWSSVTVDASSRLAPRHSPLLRFLVKVLVGNMKFPAILINPAATSTITSAPTDDKVIDQKRAFVENGAHATGTGLNRQGSLSKLRPRQRNEELKLWGLSLGMTLDLLAHMALPTTGNGADALVPPDAQMIGVPALAPSLTSVFPRFSYPDVNFWIWVFAKRYREVVRGWEASVRGGGTNDRRINWTGSALNTFYAAVRKALVVVIVVRAILVLLGFLFGGWFLFLR